jgi:hypothetical protein
MALSSYLAVWFIWILKTALLVLPLVIFGGLTLLYGAFLSKEFRSSPYVQIGSFKLGDEPAEGIAGYLMARADEIAGAIPLESLVEVNVPALENKFGSEGTSLLADFKLEFKGVDVNAILRTITALVPSRHHSVSGILTFEASRPALHFEWRHPDGKRKVWSLTSDNIPDRKYLAIGLLDKAIYRLFYYMYYDSAGPKDWRATAGPTVLFPSEKALEAYYAGRQHLGYYLLSFKRSDLDLAETNFRQLRLEMPEFADGLVLLGVTLSEKRNEAEAIAMYDMAAEIYGRKKHADTIEAKKELQARLFSATARRKIYRWAENHVALRALQKLDDDVRKAIASTQEQTTDYKRIRLAVLAEKANILSHYLVSINEPNFRSALTEGVPDLIKPIPNVRRQMVELGKEMTEPEDDPKDANYRARRAKLFLDALTEIYRIHEGVIQAAEQQQKELDDELVDSRGKPNNYSYQVFQAKGDGLYRWAHILEQDDKEFRAQCNKAIELLQRADIARPNHYAVLQSLARIYADPRFDPRGDHIASAKALYRRSIGLSATDYYGHQQLAILFIREAFQWGPEFADEEELKEALKHAEISRQLRPGSSATFLVLAQLYALHWARAEPSLRARYEQLAAASLSAAEDVNRYRERAAVPVATARLQWEFLKLRGADKDGFDAAKARLVGELEKIRKGSIAYDGGWEGRELLRVAKELGTEVAKVNYDTRFGLRWPT